jgi:hypothetical protein
VCSVVTRRSLLTFCPLRTLAPSSSLPRWLSMALSLSLSLSSSLFLYVPFYSFLRPGKWELSKSKVNCLPKKSTQISPQPP